MADHHYEIISDITMGRKVFSSSIGDPSNSSPDDDKLHTINFIFYCILKRSEWVIQSDSSEPVLVGRSTPYLIKGRLHQSLDQFLCYDKTREILDQRFRQLPLQDDRRLNMIEYIWETAFEMIKLKPKGHNVLDLYFSSSVEEKYVYDQSRLIIESHMVPTAESSIESILKRKVTIDNNMEMMTCSICLEDFSCGTEGLISMPCSHVFHGDCITLWLRTSHYCPICRFEMPTNN
ncbi:hypothetical protein DH2020_025138 [Rehmannia glutinosa]|uniref:RING-type E3 ubiquitin transferase n=1 Tax=Rehmannia glutinosa TaxID=99300 RepID=A0ABR0W0J9_REHGL